MSIGSRCCLFVGVIRCCWLMFVVVFGFVDVCCCVCFVCCWLLLLRCVFSVVRDLSSNACCLFLCVACCVMPVVAIVCCSMFDDC